MSYQIRNIREISNDPLTKFTNQLAKKLSTFLNKNETDKLENKEDIYSAGQDIDVVLRFQNCVGTHSFDFLTQYFPPTEPDYNTVKLYMKGDNLGNQLVDHSGFGNNGDLEGDPVLVDGEPFDYGIHTGGCKSLALRLNRPTSDFENEEYVNIDSSSINITAISTGISYFIRFRIFDLATQGGIERTLFEKVDDSTPNDAVTVRVSTDGRLKFYIKRSGTWYRNQTAASTITTNTVYDVFFTYANSGNTVHIYVNNVDKSLTDPGSDPTLHATLSNHDMSVFRRGAGTSGGYTYGDLYDFNIYREKVPSYNSVGTSVSFDGTGDYLNMGTQTDLWAQSKTKWSASFWIKLNSTSSQVVGGSTNWAITNGSVLFWTISPNVIGTGIWNAGAEVDAYKVITLDTTTWHHVVATYDSTLGSANLKFYYDGVLGEVTGNATTTTNPNDSMRLGWTGAGAFNGYGRDFRYWVGKTLTQTEVTNVMNNSSSAPRPNYRLQLIEGTGTPTDIISGKTASFNGNAAWINSEVGNHYTNKWTIAGIPFGQVAIANYFATYYESPSSTSFTTGSFTTGSFTG